ncbi:MAG: ATPase, T2SS/T4P/T4SS family [Polyangiaceae bacterium]
MALQKRMITREQLRQATREQARNPGRRIGEILVAQGHLTMPQLEALLAAQAQLEQQQLGNRHQTPPPVKKPVPERVAVGAIALKRVPQKRGGDDEPSSKGRATTVNYALPRPQEERREDDRRDSEARKWLVGILGDALKCGSHLVLVQPDEPVRVRRLGALKELTTGPVSASSVERLLGEALEDDTRALLEDGGQVRAVFEHPEVGRFRLDVVRHRGGLSGSFVPLPASPPSLDDLGLPHVVAGLTSYPQGLVVITSPLHGGKSSTLAAMLDLINDERADHVVAIDEVVECHHDDRTATFSQIRVGKDAPSTREALARAGRLGAGVVAVDPLQRPADIRAAMHLAETGHLVIATMLGLRSVGTIGRLVDALDGQARRRLSQTLRAVICQHLLPAAGERGMVAAVEVVHVDRHVAEAIAEGRAGQLQSALQSGRPGASRLMDDALVRLVRMGAIDNDLASIHAHHPKNFRS